MILASEEIFTFKSSDFWIDILNPVWGVLDSSVSHYWNIIFTLILLLEDEIIFVYFWRSKSKFNFTKTNLFFSNEAVLVFTNMYKCNYPI